MKLLVVKEIKFIEMWGFSPPHMCICHRDESEAVDFRKSRPRYLRNTATEKAPDLMLLSATGLFASCFLLDLLFVRGSTRLGPNHIVSLFGFMYFCLFIIIVPLNAAFSLEHGTMSLCFCFFFAPWFVCGIPMIQVYFGLLELKLCYTNALWSTVQASVCRRDYSTSYRHV